MLANDGYNIYLNADLKDEYFLSEHPWDAVRSIFRVPTVRRDFSDTVVDDSASVSPGYWLLNKDEPDLERSLDEFKLALEQIVIDKEKYRFIFIETWNSWVRGSQIEPGQEIIQDTNGYYPSGYNYGNDFIDAIAPIAIDELQWKSQGHRPIVPVHLEAEEIIWDKELEKDDVSCMIPDADTRIGSSVFFPYQQDITFIAQAKSMLKENRSLCRDPNMIVYLDDVIASQWEVEPLTYGIYSAIVPLQRGIHKVEIGLDDGEDWDLAVDFLNISATQRNYEGFETGDFSEFPWMMYLGDRDWGITSEEKSSGTYSAKAGMIEDNETTALELTLDCIFDDITFYRKVSSELGCDYLRFYIDGVEQDKWSGEKDWIQVSFPVTAGRRTFKWIYSKDHSIAEGDDTTWIDDITLPIDD